MTRASAAIILALAALPGAAQNQLWIQQFGTSSSDQSHGAAPDGVGGAFLCGSSLGRLGGPNLGVVDAWLSRYDGAGNVLWNRQFGTSALDDAAAMALDGSGGAYVSGYTHGSLGGAHAGNGDAWLARFDGSGNQLWIRQLGTSESEIVYAVAPDDSGGVFLCGVTEGDMGGPNAGASDAWLARYDGDGNRIWIRQLGTLVDDSARAVASDAADGLFVGGSTAGSLGSSAGLSDAWLARYDGAGNQVWLKQFGSSDQDAMHCAALDGSGCAYVGGGTGGTLGGPTSGGYDSWIARYDGAGNQSWIRQFGTAHHDQSRGLASDGLGGVFSCGWIIDNLGINFDAWGGRLDGVGNLSWIAVLATNESDRAYAVARSQPGQMVVAGASTGDLGGPNGGNFDGWIAMFESCSITTYCVGATNSTGKGASIGYQGSTSLAQNNLALMVQGCPPFQPGIFFFGLFQTQVAFGDGWLCVTGQQKRLLPAVFLNASGAGSYQVDFTDPLSPASTIQAGDTRNFQFWYRDPQPVGSGFNLSNGLAAYFCQ